MPYYIYQFKARFLFMGNYISRKKFIAATALTAINLPGALSALGENHTRPVLSKNNLPATENRKICIFSKCLQWLNYQEMGTLAAAVGFDGIDLTVRKNGHVLPENVLIDLPKAVEIIEKAGLKVYMITTDITDADEPYTRNILQSAAGLGIKYYRTNWFQYNSAIDIPANIEVFRKRLTGLSQLNKKYGIEAAYQNHAGQYFGASVWDLWLAIKDLDFISCQYDIRHATVEGPGTWATGLNLLHQHINTIAIKDFTWVRNGTKWVAESVPLGEGLVDFSAFLNLINQYHISGPVTMHFEFPLGGAEDGQQKINITAEEFKATIKNELEKFKSLLGKSN
jgi:sugar phosphate isomerase/epimerase